MFKKTLFFFGLLTLFFLVGCERDPLPSKNFFIRTPQERYAQVAKLKYWQTLGVISIQQTGEKPVIAEFYWNVMNQSYRIRLTSVLGLFRIEICRAFGSIKLWKNSTLVYTAKTPEGLLQKTPRGRVVTELSIRHLKSV